MIYKRIHVLRIAKEIFSWIAFILRTIEYFRFYQFITANARKDQFISLF